MIDLLRMTADADFWFFAWSASISASDYRLIFIPITTTSYEGLPPSKTDQASALINLARNFGGSMGVSLTQTVLARREQFHQERLVENVGSWNPFSMTRSIGLTPISEPTLFSEVRLARASPISGRWSNHKRPFLPISTSSLHSR